MSVAGAQGLMQLMPGVSAEVGVANATHPEANIRAGVLYLRRLSNQFREAESSDRLALVLAAYFLGPGHVFDAQDLARELGLNAQTWRRGIEETLPLTRRRPLPCPHSPRVCARTASGGLRQSHHGTLRGLPPTARAAPRDARERGASPRRRLTVTRLAPAGRHRTKARRRSHRSRRESCRAGHRTGSSVPAPSPPRAAARA